MTSLLVTLMYPGEVSHLSFRIISAPFPNFAVFFLVCFLHKIWTLCSALVKLVCSEDFTDHDFHEQPAQVAAGQKPKSYVKIQILHRCFIIPCGSSVFIEYLI